MTKKSGMTANIWHLFKTDVSIYTETNVVRLLSKAKPSPYEQIQTKKTQIHIATKTGWTDANDFYPVEELFKLLNEQLHSSSLHCSTKRTIEELQHKDKKHCYKMDISALYEGFTL